MHGHWQRAAGAMQWFYASLHASLKVYISLPSLSLLCAQAHIGIYLPPSPHASVITMRSVVELPHSTKPKTVYTFPTVASLDLSLDLRLSSTECTLAFSGLGVGGCQGCDTHEPSCLVIGPNYKLLPDRGNTLLPDRQLVFGPSFLPRCPCASLSVCC
ncbi:hypothetical protein F4808DRAFT_282157 [Astrocystis sublimbata]|nr:hypothetical protein F4808DRAFT_282157 [Astrocystis sublimbata]